jgi:hypothetical protein
MKQPKFLSKISQEIYLKKKLNKTFVQMRKSWEEIYKIINTRG